MQVIQDLLQQLYQDTGANCLLLSDTVGMPLLGMGKVDGLRSDLVGPLLAPGFYVTGEFARQLDDRSPQALYLYEGARHNIYALNVDQRYLLTLVVDTTQHSGVPAPIWALAKRAIRRMQKILKK
jgi:predicted regulator of Ras-like GTPase activity (Roadblock/LC7/MglB family)